jgi:hypothetical protein
MSAGAMGGVLLSARWRALVLVVATIAAGCSHAFEPIGLELGRSTSFEADWHRYGRVRSSKAFAYAGDPKGLSVTGLAYGMASRVEAETRALDYCEEQRIARGLATPCVIYAVDGEIVDVAARVPADLPSRPGS